jgi:hypothetical protein
METDSGCIEFEQQARLLFSIVLSLKSIFGGMELAAWFETVTCFRTISKRPGDNS